jgi:hypothetical protein
MNKELKAGKLKELSRPHLLMLLALKALTEGAA